MTKFIGDTQKVILEMTAEGKFQTLTSEQTARIDNRIAPEIDKIIREATHILKNSYYAALEIERTTAPKL